MKRTVFFISDGTGITAETLGDSLLTQFEQIQFDKITIPYIDTPEKARLAVEQINAAATQDGWQPIVFSTLVDPATRTLVQTCRGLFLDFFTTFIGALERELQMPSTHHVGRMHGLVDYKAYMTRMEAVNYTLSHDDGLRSQNYDDADLILVGVSRCGKTPTSLYLALQFGLYAAIYPFTADDMGNLVLPDILKVHRTKLFGLSIDPVRLQLIRQERRPNSQYASLAQCQEEVRKVEQLFQRENIPFLSSTTRSIEEIASSVLSTMGLKRKLSEH
jgi:[pyruvate, water dikinase]-phosphate phosphotransferase / [pyruvate, water dikinase] kinase